MHGQQNIKITLKVACIPNGNECPSYAKSQ